MVVEDLHVSYARPAAGVRGLLSSLRRRSGGGRASARRVHAVRGVSLTAYRGDVVGVVGGNGAGKSTLLRAVAGLVPPDRGRVYARRRPALLGVNPGLVGDLSGEHNIVLGCTALGMSIREAREHLDEVADFADLGDALRRPLRTYSTGQAQRLRFAISTAGAHEVLLVDEALAAGDAAFRSRSVRRLAELRDRAATVFLVSHSLSAIRESCERAVWLHDGAVRMDDRVGPVLAAYRAHQRAEADEDS